MATIMETFRQFDASYDVGILQMKSYKES
jgi:hypothetical protein